MANQNRVLPDGSVVSMAEHGEMMGNRGGRFHEPARGTLHPTRRWSSRRWITCVTEFRGRHRKVMGEGYTHLFFLDEVTALAAGHRPCFECRRADAKDFSAACQAAQGLQAPPGADAMDRELHADRTGMRDHLEDWRNLPDGAMVRLDDGRFAAAHQCTLFEWSPVGYKPIAKSNRISKVQRLTPRLTIEAFRAGYKPVWHSSFN